MIKNYIKTTLRHITLNLPNYSFKTGGVALALFGLLVIILYTTYQWSFDSFHHDPENIYRVNSLRDEDGKIVPYSMVPPAIGPALKDNFHEVTAFARFGVASRVIIQYENKLIRLTGFVEADSSIFSVLSFQFIQGDKRALREPGSVVLTQSTALQIFGNEDPMNKILISPDHTNRTLVVKGIIQDFPSNSHLTINALHSFGSLNESNLASWEITWDGSLNLYVRLAPGSDPASLAKKAQPILSQNLIKTESGAERNFSLSLQQIEDIYLTDPLKMEFSKKGNAMHVRIFVLLAIFLIVIASINYINLTIADFDTRTREIGIRKVLGARKLQIALQIALEAILVFGVAMAIAVALLYQFFPIVNLLEPNLALGMLTQTHVLIPACLVVITMILLSAAYPWKLITRRTAAFELKASSVYSSGTSAGRILLIIQYAISIICICSTLIIGRQLSFIKTTDPGYDRSHVISLVMPDEYPAERIPVLKNDMNQVAGVSSVSYSYYLMPISTYFKDWYHVEQHGQMEKMLLNEMFVDADYFETMGIPLVSGRNFNLANKADVTSACIINETAAKEFGWTQPLGKRIRTGYDHEGTESMVVGVVKDFHSLSLHRKIEPVILRLQPDTWPGNALNVRFTGEIADILPVITATYERVMPGYLADVRVLDDLHNNQYRTENNAFAALQISTLVIIAISIAGVFSLSLFLSVRRLREFGIRKVLGASSSQILRLQITYFLKVGFIANLLALPLAYWLMQEWLDHFAYKQETNIFIFLTVTAGSFVLAVVSSGYPAFNAAKTNPADIIRAQ